MAGGALKELSLVSDRGAPHECAPERKENHHPSKARILSARRFGDRRCCCRTFPRPRRGKLARPGSKRVGSCAASIKPNASRSREAGGGKCATKAVKSSDQSNPANQTARATPRQMGVDRLRLLRLLPHKALELLEAPPQPGVSVV